MIHQSLRKKLVHEDRWSRVFEVEPNYYAYESKFEADGLSASVEQIRAEWEGWSDSERLNFAKAFRHKRTFGKREEEIVEFLMQNGDERIWSTIALLLTQHSEKSVVLSFLLERLKVGTEPKSNYIQALYVLRDAGALPGLHALHDRLREQIHSAQADRWAICDFLKCCEAMVFLEGGENYRDEIRGFLGHPDEVVRGQATIALAGPQPEEFGVEG